MRIRNNEPALPAGTAPFGARRLWLRRFRKEDVQAMYHGYARYEEAARYMTWSVHPSPRLCAAFIGGVGASL